MDPVREALWRLGGGPPLHLFYAVRGEATPPWKQTGGLRPIRAIALCVLARGGKHGRWQVVEVHGAEGAHEYIEEARAAGVPIEAAHGRLRRRLEKAARGHIIRDAVEFEDQEVFNRMINMINVNVSITYHRPIEYLTINGVIKL